MCFNYWMTEMALISLELFYFSFDTYISMYDYNGIDKLQHSLNIITKIIPRTGFEPVT